MIALTALVIVSVWIALCAFLARKTPRWLGIRPIGGFASFLLFLVLFIAPFIDHIVGMWQFNRLCVERAVVWVSPEAGKVKKARSPLLPAANIPGQWITILSQPLTYIDVETGEPFIKYEGLLTKGGRVAQIGLLGQTFTCWPKDAIEISKRLKTDELLKQGEKP